MYAQTLSRSPPGTHARRRSVRRTGGRARTVAPRGSASAPRVAHIGGAVRETRVSSRPYDSSGTKPQPDAEPTLDRRIASGIVVVGGCEADDAVGRRQTAAIRVYRRICAFQLLDDRREQRGAGRDAVAHRLGRCAHGVRHLLGPFVRRLKAETVNHEQPARRRPAPLESSARCAVAAGGAVPCRRRIRWLRSQPAQRPYRSVAGPRHGRSRARRSR